MNLEFKRLSEIDCSQYIALNTHPLVRRQMPLTSDKFDEREWIAIKGFIRYQLYPPTK